MNKALTNKAEIETGTLKSADAVNAFALQVTFGFTTIDRRNAAFAAVRALRLCFPDNRLMVVDQNEPDIEARAFYADQNVDVRFVEYDIGLSAARNLMFRECSTQYFFMLDDDVVEIPDEEMRNSFSLMCEDSRVLVVGGRGAKLSEGDDRKVVRKINPPFNNFLFRKPEAQFALLFDPGVIDSVPTPRYDKDENYRIADVVENFALFDVEKYRELGLSWDNELKIVVEHLDFYLNTQERRKGREDYLIVANPRMIAFDVDAATDSTMEKYRKKRYRQDFRALYSRKWRIAAEMHLGKWTNVLWENGELNTVKWTELPAFGERQKLEYKKAGDENIRSFGAYPIGNKRVSFIATTVDRFDSILALAISIRDRFGEAVEILLGLQCEIMPDGFVECAHALNVRLVPMAYDIGLSAARNRLVEQVNTEYIVLCDDDFVVDSGLHMGNALRILDDEPEVAGVGGAYRDVIYDQNMHLKELVERNFTFQCVYEPHTGALIRVPFYHLPASVCYDWERGAMPADILQNFALLRTEEFGPNGLYWDERMKISGEHMDFYVKNLLVDKKVFLFDPGFSVRHNRVFNPAYLQRRRRTDGIELFYDKWNIRFEIDTELGIRSPSRGDIFWRKFAGM